MWGACAVSVPTVTSPIRTKSVMTGVLPLEHRWKDGHKDKYQEVAKGADYMDSVVGKQPDDNLLKAVNLFLKEKQK